VLSEAESELALLALPCESLVALLGALTLLDRLGQDSAGNADNWVCRPGWREDDGRGNQGTTHTAVASWINWHRITGVTRVAKLMDIEQLQCLAARIKLLFG
jgi:hypothetical protein